MATDTWTQTVEVAAPLKEVLVLLRDIALQPDWIPEILEAEVVEESEDGLPTRARIAASTAVGTDRYTLAYQHAKAGMSWHLVEGRLQTGQEGVYTLEPAGRGRTKVTYHLTISHNLPLPGFIRRRTIKGLVGHTLAGLKERLES